MNRFLNAISGNGIFQKDAYSIRFLLLSLLVPVITFSDLEPVFGPGVDGPMPWVFNYFFDGHMQDGKDIIFPHGPLAFLMYPVPMGNNLAFAIAVHFLLKFFFSFLLFRVAAVRGHENILAPFLLSILFCGMFDVLFLFIGTIALCITMHYFTDKKGWLISAIILCSISIYVRAFGGITGLLLSGSYFLTGYFRDRSWKALLQKCVSQIMGIAVIWMLLYQNPSGLLRFMYGLFQLSQDNSSAVAVYPDNNWFFLFMALVFLLLIPFMIREKNVRIFYAMFALPLFACWKYAMAREDIFHALTLFILLLFFFTLIYFVSEKKPFIIIVIGLLSCGFYYANLENVIDLRTPALSNTGLNTFRKFTSEYDSLSKYYNALSYRSIEANKLDDNTLKKIASATTDIYPWDYTYIPANKLNWQPRPVIQSYASYTSWLDKQNKEHFESEKAPRYLIWQNTANVEDVSGAGFSSIDGRYLLNDEPQTILSIINRYSFSNRTEKYMVFSKSDSAGLESETKTGSSNMKMNAWVNVPYSGDGILRARLNIRHGLTGTLKSFFYKSPAFYIHYELENGDELRYRIVPKNARDGLWINPLLLYDNNLIESPVKRIKITSNDSSAVNNEIEAEWYFSALKPHLQKVKYRETHAGAYGNALALFGKTENYFINTKNNFSQQITGWTYDKNKVDTKDYLSAPNSMRVEPGAFSMSYELSFDSTEIGNAKGILIKSNIAVKRATEGDTKLVIDVLDENGKNILWDGTSVLINEPQKWNVCRASTILGREKIKGRITLKIYVWNPGKTEVLADDFSVRAELIR